MLDSDDAIAIVGLATIIPGAEDVEGFWLNLLRGRETGGSPASLPPRSGVAARETSGLLSHVTYAAIENAGYDPAAVGRDVLVVTVADTAGSDRLPSLGSVVAGPAHDSGLAALRPASHALRAGTCDMAVVAGATAGQLDRGGAADHGGAACAVVVKRLRDALADYDHIWAVIRGIAVSDENAAMPGDIAATADAALTLAGARPDDISYVETCGVGSPRPDEVAALTQAYRGAGEVPAPGRYRLGGIGSSAGPLGPISGLAGMVKVALALEREQLPPSTADPLLDLDSPFQTQDRIAGWPRDPRRPRLAAVNALSAGATGAHVVLAEAPAQSYAMHAEEPAVLVWSGRSAVEERVVRAKIARFFVWRGEEVFADAAATLREGRATHPVRAAAVCTDALAAAAVLGAVDSPDVITAGGPASIASSVTLRFPGNGSALAALGLYRGVPAFARAVDGWLDLLDGPELPVRNYWRTADPVTAAASSAPSSAPFSAPSDARSPGAELDAALLFAVEAALGRLWLEAGLRPVVVVGDGIGLLAAATVTEVFAPADAAALVRVAVGTGGVDVLERAVAGVPAKPPMVPLRCAGAPRSVTAAEAGHPAFWAAAVRTPPVTDARSGEAREGASEEVSVGPDSLPTVGGVLTTAARLWTHGYDVAWDRLAQPPLRHRVPMPGAGFEPAAAGALLYPLAAAVRPVRRGATRLGIDVVIPADSGPLVLALPYAGASGRALNAVRRYLPTGCGLALVDLPGHGRRMGEECLRDVDAVVDELMAMVTTLPASRLLLLGYSLGGSFSYELAVRLVEAGTPPEGLIVCGSRSPQTGVGHPPIAHLPSGDPFLREAVALGLAAREMLELPELAESFVGPLQADLVMVESFPYRPSRPRLPVPTCVVGMRGDWVVPEPSLRGWDDLCVDPPLQLRVDGGHLALHEREREFGETVHRAIEYLLERGQPAADAPIGRATSTAATR